MTKFYSMFVEFFKESGRVHTFPAGSTPQQREEFTHQPHGDVVTDTKYSDLHDKDIMMPLLIYP